MNKMHLIIRQEYLNRVRKRSFIAMTLLMPFLFVALMSFPHWMSKINDTETHDIIVLDYTGSYKNLFTDTSQYRFYYRMTGDDMPTSNKIEWVKKGKKRKKDISKSSLVYFLKTFANYNVDQTLDCRNRIDEIFGISLPTSTITRISNCEYKTEIDDIVSIRREIVEI